MSHHVRRKKSGGHPDNQPTSLSPEDNLSGNSGNITVNPNNNMTEVSNIRVDYSHFSIPNQDHVMTAIPGGSYPVHLPPPNYHDPSSHVLPSMTPYSVPLSPAPHYSSGPMIDEQGNVVVLGPQYVVNEGGGNAPPPPQHIHYYNHAAAATHVHPAPPYAHAAPVYYGAWSVPPSSSSSPPHAIAHHSAHDIVLYDYGGSYHTNTAVYVANTGTYKNHHPTVHHSVSYPSVQQQQQMQLQHTHHLQHPLTHTMMQEHQGFFNQRSTSSSSNNNSSSSKSISRKNSRSSNRSSQNQGNDNRNMIEDGRIGILADQLHSFDMNKGNNFSPAFTATSSFTTSTGAISSSPGTVLSVGGLGASSSPASGDGIAGGRMSAELQNALFFVKRNPGVTLFDVNASIIANLAIDPEGSRFLQKRIKLGTHEERHLALEKVLPHLALLWQDASGNYVLQQLLEHGDEETRNELMKGVEKEGVVALSLHMHGCRVVQKAIKCLDQTQVTTLITKFRSQVLNFTHDPNGNHVIQKCIQVMSSLAKAAASRNDTDMASSLSDQLQFVVDDVVANVESLSKHRYGCRVVQRAIEFCVEHQKDAVLKKIVECHASLVDDQYGNYVIQQSLVCGREEHQREVIKTLIKNDGSFVRLSKHKYASNVVEGMLKNGTDQHRVLILEELLKPSISNKNTGPCCAIELALDPIANYVVKSALECTKNGAQVEKLTEALNAHRMELVGLYPVISRPGCLLQS